jgi:murein DD-endopeptidase MepM/ murein hydrolase activator NlpD
VNVARAAAGLLFFAAGILQMKAAADRVNLVLPTANTALLRGDGAAFYQVVQRNINGVVSYPWEGGKYGFVRDPRELAGQIVFTRFHEGMDIRPLQRDARGEPLDDVRSIAEGRVVYTSERAGASNYGRYVVVEHRWDGCPYYSLYAHLNTIAVHAGQSIKQGDKLGVMGYTGAGIDRARAHVHVELNLLLSSHFEAWHETFFANEVNHHGIYNGINLTGLDLPRLFLALQSDPALTIPLFLSRETPFYKVLIPNSTNFELPHRYPWMITGLPNEKPSSWEISFAASGLPLRIAPSSRVVSAPELSWIKPSPIDARYLTRENVTGRGATAHLTDSGKALMRLLNFPD